MYPCCDRCRLTTARPNQEKYFYFALQKHRAEQLENYIGDADALIHSGSDYHHIKSQQPSMFPAPLRRMSRTRSQFSILNDEHIQSRNSFLEPTPSERSYDPYRSSKSQVTARKGSYVNVTIHRNGSKHSRSHSTGASNSRNPGSLRVEALKQEQRRVSTASRASSSASFKRTSMSSRPRAGTARSNSRSSMGSSLPATSSPIVIKPSSKHKRPVNFSHLRRGSNASGQATQSASNLTVTPQKSHAHDKHSSPDLREPLSSPISDNGMHVKAKKDAQNLQLPRPRTRRGNTNSLVIDTEARKVSTELGQYCEQVFNHRSSSTSSHATSATTAVLPYDTPPSSVSNWGSTPSAQESRTPTASLRPLPETPTATPNTVVAREIAETRKRLAAYAADERNPQTYTDVMAQLDALLMPRVSHVEQKRATSLPEPKHSEFSSFLPPISEEEKAYDGDLGAWSQSAVALQSLSSQQPINKGLAHPWEHDPTTTIRMIDTSSPPRPAPLNIRKTSSVNNPVLKPDVIPRFLDTQSTSETRTRRATNPTSPIRPNMSEAGTGNASNKQHHAVAQQKKWAWWRKNKSSDIELKTDMRSTSCEMLPASTEFEKYWKRQPSDSTRNDPLMSGGLLSPKEFGSSGKRPGFLHFLRRPTKLAQHKGFGSGKYSSMSCVISCTDMGIS